MPGLLGYWTETEEAVSPGLLAAMGGVMQHQPGLKVETTLYPGFGAGRVHLGYFQPGIQPARDRTGRYSLWLDGEFTNASELIRCHDLEHMGPQEQARLALALYLKTEWAFLRDVDGLFALALYDQECHQLTLVNDRYGLRPLYWVRTSQGLAYAGEVKALLAVPGVEVRIDPLAVDEWFSFRYLLGNRTWIEGIELYPPATIMQVSAEGVEARRYWTWRDIQPLSGNVNEEEVVEELGRLWIRAVEKRVDDHRIGISLSGGLDSRAVLAAMPAATTSLHLITFGKAGCDDCRIAARAAEVRQTPHSFVEIDTRSWLRARLPSMWRTDGLLHVLDMHGVQAHPHYERHVEIDVHSFAGDLILGGSYLNKNFTQDWPNSFPLVLQKMWLKSPLVSLEQASRLLGCVFRDYSGLSHSDYFFLDARVRRFTNCGTIALSSMVERRFPTYDRDLLTFVYSLPDELRLESRIYKKMLLGRFPDYYETIPWQKTGLPIGAPKWRCELNKITRVLQDRMRLMGTRVGVPYRPSRWTYTNYPAWLRMEPARGLVTRLLLSDDACYAAYLDADVARAVVEHFLETEYNRHLKTIGLLLTFEIYLRQLFDESDDFSGETLRHEDGLSA